MLFFLFLSFSFLLPYKHFPTEPVEHLFCNTKHWRIGGYPYIRGRVEIILEKNISDEEAQAVYEAYVMNSEEISGQRIRCSRVENKLKTQQNIAVVAKL